MASIKGQEKAKLAQDKIEANKKIIKKINAFLETEFTAEKLTISHENGKTPFVCDEETIKELLNNSIDKITDECIELVKENNLEFDEDEKELFGVE